MSRVVRRSRVTSGLVLGVLGLALFAATAHGQFAQDGFDPNANGVVFAQVVQSDGKILIGGQFTSVAGLPGNRIARLNPDGTRDFPFNPNADNLVFAIALQPDGKILIGGTFANIGGQPRNRIARLNPDGTLDTAFNPSANGDVASIVVQPDGEILVGGFFTLIAGQPRVGIARLNADGTADAFNPIADNFVYSIALQSDGKILAGGGFTSIGGQTRNRIARLDAATGAADAFNPNASDAVLALAVQSNGKILVGGNFTAIAGQPRNRIARLDSDGALDSFDPNASSSIFSLVLQPDGKILAGGNFTTIGGQARNRIARLNSDGTADSFNPNANNLAYSIAVQSDGKILAGGYFTDIGGQTRNHIARLESDGSLDRTLALDLGGYHPSPVLATVTQPDGKILIGGTFIEVSGAPRHGIARLNPDGTLDTGFTPEATVPGGFTVLIWAITLQPDGKILVGGIFSLINGQARNNIARLNPDGTLDDSFNTNTIYTVWSIALQADGKILVGAEVPGGGGVYSRVGLARLNPDGTDDSFIPNQDGSAHLLAVQPDGKILACCELNGFGRYPNFARFNPDGTPDSFDPQSDYHPGVMAVQPDGKILVSGYFSTIGGQPRHRIARLNPDGTADMAFDPQANDVIETFALQSDGKILVGGKFTTIGGQPRNRIARLDGATGAPDSFNPNADKKVRSITLQSDGKILVGGDFTYLQGIPPAHDGFVRLSNDTAALQHLSATQTTVTWTRGGSSPQFTRVIFEQSTDGTNFTFLGDGTWSSTPTASVFTLTGLNLPTGQNLFIRGRGVSRASIRDGSESIQDTTILVSLATPGASETATPTATATAMLTATPTVTGAPTPAATATATATSTGTSTTTLAGTATPTAMATTPTPQPTSTTIPLGPFTCYQAGAPKGAPKFAAIAGVSLVDQFSPSTVAVKMPTRLCAPTQKDSEPPSAAPDEHLKAYPVKPEEKFVKVLDQVVVDQFGTRHYDILKPGELLVPTAKSLVSPPPELADPAIDHFQCYKVKDLKLPTKFQPVVVTLVDQFQSLQVKVTKPWRLCAPTSTNGEDPSAPSHANHLMCYRVKDLKLPAFARVNSVFVNDQFGPEILDVKKPAELCVPAVMNP